VVRLDKFRDGVEILHHPVVVWGIPFHDRISRVQLAKTKIAVIRLLCKLANFKGVTSNETRLEECCINEVWK
jgi:hypothetical protein